MHHSFHAVRKIHHSLVRPTRHGLRVVAVMLAMVVGIGGHFIECNHQLKELDINNVVEQIQSTIERREEIKELTSTVCAKVF